MKAVPHERIIDIETEELRSYLTVLAAAGRSVGTITTANATNVLALVRRLGLWAPALVEDLRRGGLPQRILTDGGQERSVSWTAAQQRRLAGLFRPRGRRAERLRRILHRPDWCLTELWPQLTAVNCWRGGVSSFFLERLAPRLGGLPVRDPGYSASEGVFAIPIESGTAAGVPHLTGNFFEFVPAAEDPRHADARGVHELEQGAEYRVIVTTAGGLMRYDMGDIVAVEGRYRAAPLLAFRRKAGSMLNLTGEKLAEDQVVSAVRRAAAQSGVDLEGFTLTARLEEVPIPLLLAEAAGAVAPERLARFEALLDAELCLANEEYEAKRRSGRLAGATVYWLASGALRCYQADRVAQGAPPTQVKLPAVSAPDAVPRVLQPEGWAQ